MTDLATVTDIRDQRARKVPAWNPHTRKHAWENVNAGHRCLHCTVYYHSVDVDGVWWKAWTLGERSGRTRKMPPCPGPQRHPELVPAPVEVPAQPQADDIPVRLCARCNPPCGRPGRLHLGGYSCAEVVAAAGAATREWIRGMRPSGGAA
jgi:hypothetical protein